MGESFMSCFLTHGVYTCRLVSWCVCVCVCVGGRNAGEAGCRRWSERGVCVSVVEMLEKPGVGGGVNVVCVCRW